MAHRESVLSGNSTLGSPACQHVDLEDTEQGYLSMWAASCFRGSWGLNFIFFMLLFCSVLFCGLQFLSWTDSHWNILYEKLETLLHDYIS